MVDRIWGFIEANNFNTICIFLLFLMIIMVGMIPSRYRVKIEKTMSAPFSIICALVFATIIGLLYWYHFTIMAYSDLIYLFTLIIVTLYTYYTLQVVKYAYKGPALLHVQMQHSDILKDFLKKWQKLIGRDLGLPIIENTIGEGGNYFSRFILIYKKIKEEWEYNDLTKYHLPHDFKYLDKNWTDFINQIEKLGGKIEEFYQSLDEEINAELMNIERDFPSTRLSAATGHYGLKDAIFLRCLGKEEDIEFAIKPWSEDKSILIASKIILHEKSLLTGNRDDLILAKERLEKIALKGYIEDKYANLIADIKENNKTMYHNRQHLVKQLDELIKWTLLPGTSCERIKEFRIDFKE